MIIDGKNRQLSNKKLVLTSFGLAFCWISFLLKNLFTYLLIVFFFNINYYNKEGREFLIK